MPDEIPPEETFRDIITRGINVFQTVIHGVSDALRSGDGAIRELDHSLTGEPIAPGETPDQTFLGVLALINGAMEEAQTTGSASTPEVMQKARAALGRLVKVEPAWRPGPTIIKTTADMMRVALRDLRGSESLLKVVGGQGQLTDLESLIDWASDVSKRLNDAQTVVARPKPTPAELAPETPAAEVPTPPAAPTKKKKKGTKPKQKGDSGEVAFAQAVAQELGDIKVKGWAQDFADGKISEDQWISRLTTHCAAVFEDLDGVFERAGARMPKESSGN